MVIGEMVLTIPSPLSLRASSVQSQWGHHMLDTVGQARGMGVKPISDVDPFMSSGEPEAHELLLANLSGSKHTSYFFNKLIKYLIFAQISGNVLGQLESMNSEPS